MRNFLFVSVSISVSVIAFSILYYFVIFLPGSERFARENSYQDQQEEANKMNEEKTIENTNYLTPTPVQYNIIVPSSTSTSIPTNYEAVCGARKEEFSGLMKAKWNELVSKKYTPETESVLLELKYKIDDCLLVCVPKYYLYCLEHNGDLAGFDWLSACPQCNFNN